MMILQTLNSCENFKINDRVPSYADHCLITKKITQPFQYPEHFTGLGIIAILNGVGEFKVNGLNILLDQNGFFVVNRGSKLSFRISDNGGTLVLLYFNTLLSQIITNHFFIRNSETRANGNVDELSDFSLVEHIHYMNATMKNYLPLLIDLGSSCASFHALKADMLVRTILDDLVGENYSAIRISANFAVIKKSTRVELYKRLQLSKEWIAQNYSSPITVDQVSDIAMLNSHHFLRLFKKAYNITPHQYLTDIRVGKAKSLLQETDDPISSICRAVGFESLSSFSGLFKQRSGVSPGVFRLQHH